MICKTANGRAVSIHATKFAQHNVASEPTHCTRATPAIVGNKQSGGGFGMWPAHAFCRLMPRLVSQLRYRFVEYNEVFRDTAISCIAQHPICCRVAALASAAVPLHHYHHGTNEQLPLAPTHQFASHRRRFIVQGHRHRHRRQSDQEAVAHGICSNMKKSSKRLQKK
jgi:hypothetical protein